VFIPAYLQAGLPAGRQAWLNILLIKITRIRYNNILLMKEACGIFGIYNHPEAANITYLGLYSLQHRGQESAGIVSSDGKKVYLYVNMGLVADVFSKEILEKLKGHIAIGHCRYSTAGSTTIENAQPICISYSNNRIAIAHNGNIVNSSELREKLEKEGSIFHTTSDSEIILHLIAKSKENSFIDKVTYALSKVKGAYSLLIMNENTILAIRDPNGFRPLSLGKLGDSFCVASETCAFDLIGAEYIRTIEPGEILEISSSGINSYFPFPKVKESACIFEFIYFSRPDSYIFGKSCLEIRKMLGKELAKVMPVDADIVSGVPDSSTVAALGYAEESGIKFDLCFIRNHYVGRTFIEPKQSIRDFGAKVKYNPIQKIIENKKVIVVDDSIVRGTTSKKLVKMVRRAGAKEIHWRIASPPIISPCYYGIDTPTKEELIASSHSVEEIREFLGVDSLCYLPLEVMKKCVKEDKYCTACFSGEYPIPLTNDFNKLKFEEKIINKVR
jgi:amidophosphoribosyltransferase